VFVRCSALIFRGNITISLLFDKNTSRTRKFIGHEPFAVLLWDDIVRAENPCLKQMIDLFDVHQSSILGAQIVPDEDVSKYGIIDGLNIADRLHRIRSLI
jgi:UTP--glucose-1-phosphate uridylyltransferase